MLRHTDRWAPGLHLEKGLYSKIIVDVRKATPSSPLYFSSVEQNRARFWAVHGGDSISNYLSKEQFSSARYVRDSRYIFSRISEQTYFQSLRGVLEGMDLNWSLSLCTYLLCVTGTIGEGIVVEVVSACAGLCGDEIFKFLKALSGAIKSVAEVDGPNWRFVVNMENLGGYQDVGDEGFLEDVSNWVGGQDLTHKLRYPDASGNWTYAGFMRAFEDALPVFFSRVNIVPGEVVSPAEWLADPERWATNGSTSATRRPVYTVKGKDRRAAKTKWATAAEYTHDELLSMFWSRGRQKAVAVQKREPAKVRAVISADLPVYLRMAWLSEWMERHFADLPSTLWMTNRRQMDFWASASRDVDGRGIQVPIDQSKFDHNVTKDMLSAMCRYMRERFGTLAGSEWVQVMKLVEEDLTRTYSVRVNVGSNVVTVPVLQGLLSGWRWTAMFDTIINYTEQVMAERLVAQEFAEICTPKRQLAQGDDVYAVFHRVRDAGLFCGALEAMGLEVNPNKFFVSKRVNEFLRRLVYKDEVTGYPARAMLGICWRNPLSQEARAGENRMREQLNQWSVLSGRLGVGELSGSIRNMMLRDLSRGSGLKQDTVALWLNTPSSLKGGGVVAGHSVLPGLGIRGGDVVHNTKWRSMRGADALRRNWARLGHSWSRDVEMKWLDSVLTAPLADVEVKEMVFEETPAVVWERGQKSTVDIGPKWRRDIPSTGRTIIVDDLLADKAWDDVIALMSDDWRERATLLFRRCSRNVWIDWVRGKLPFNAPVVWGCGSQWVSVHHEDYARYFWLKVTSRAKVGRGDVVLAAVSAEMNTRNEISRSAWKFRA